MRTPVNLLLLFVLLLTPVMTEAQISLYQEDNSIKVYAYGNERPLAWCGGFNNPQFSMGDLNHDGLKDLIVFTPWTGIQTFINKGTAGSPDFRYEPDYATNFPPIYDYLILEDYNCDNIPDLFHQGGSGFSVYRGYYNSYNQLCFTYYQDLYYSNDIYAGGYANAFNNPGDIPSIADVDQDGDLDFISYNITGGAINLYRNMQVELGLPCDSIHIALKDRCWGKVYQGFYRTHMLAYSCDNSGLRSSSTTKKTHSGNTPCLFDWDMDGDYDYLDGSISFNEMTFLKNGRKETGAGIDTMIMQDTTWQSGGKAINIPIWPAAFNIDVDGDGKRDIVVAPNGGNASENYKCIWYYQNLSTPGSPNWQFRSDSFLTDKTIDLGSASYPALFDYDKDGKPDLFVGSDGYYQSGGTLLGMLSYYRNTTTSGGASLTLETNDFMGLSSNSFKGAAPAFGDIDDDGKSDMLIGHSDGTISYYQNMAASDLVTPDWQLAQVALKDNNGNTINAGGNAAPFIYDIDKDGKKDLIIGDISGYVEYYRNISTAPGTISLQLINMKLGKAKADPKKNRNLYCAPYIGKIDSTGVEYLLLGSYSGNIYRYTGFQSGDTSATYTLLDTNYAYIDSSYNLYNHPGQWCGVYSGLRSTPVVGDLVGDGGFEMIIGNTRGGLQLYKQKIYVPKPIDTNIPKHDPAEVTLYPNPVRNLLTVKWTGIQSNTVHLEIVNLLGQDVYSATVPTANGNSLINTELLPAGMYICAFDGGGKKVHVKFVKEW